MKQEERGEKRYRDPRRGGGGRGGGERHSPLSSLNEVFFLFLCVCVVAVSIDDGCVGVGRIVRSFGFVCQVCSCGNEKQTPLSRKTNTEQLGVAFAARGYKHTPENNMANTTLFIYRLEEKLR